MAPTQPLTVVLQRADEGRLVEQHRWGLVPSFAKSLKDGAKRINARAETVASSPRSARRSGSVAASCPATASTSGAGPAAPSSPTTSTHRADAVLALAGVWAVWKDPETGLWVPSAAVITTEANRMMSGIHDRMPVLLPREAWDDWLDPAVDDTDYLKSLLEPPPDDVLEMYPISTAVNNVRNQGPQLLERAPEASALGLEGRTVGPTARPAPPPRQGAR